MMITAWARSLKSQLLLLYLAIKDWRTPWYVRVFGWAVIGYALSPIDLIPDFIPVLGYLDDVILLPIGLYLLWKLIPAQVLAEVKEQIQERENTETKLPMNYVAGGLVLLLWVLIGLVTIYVGMTFMSQPA